MLAAAAAAATTTHTLPYTHHSRNDRPTDPTGGHSCPPPPSLALGSPPVNRQSRWPGALTATTLPKRNRPLVGWVGRSVGLVCRHLFCQTLNLPCRLAVMCVADTRGECVYTYTHQSSYFWGTTMQQFKDMFLLCMPLQVCQETVVTQPRQLKVGDTI